jgi:hypothetical protein
MNVSKISQLVLAVFLTTLLLVTCTTNEVSDPLGVGNFSQTGLTSLTNSTGIEKTTFYTYETILLSIEGLIPLEQTNIEVIEGCPECENTIKRAVVVTDRDGKIVNLPVWHHIGVDKDGTRIDQTGGYTILITQPPKHDPWTRYEICFEVVNDISPDPQVHVADASGVFKGQAALVGEDVYAMAYHVAAASVKLLVVDAKTEYAVGDVLTDVSGGAETVAPDGSGSIPATLVWPGAGSVGSYDLVVDAEPFDEYNEGDVVSQMIFSGLVVQNAPSAQNIVADIACDMSGTFVNNFDELDAVFARIEPMTRPADLTTWETPIPSFVPVFVVPHKDVWTTGDRMVTIRTVGTHQMPSYVQLNPVSGSVSLFRLRGETKSGYYQPLRLWPGDYDLIVDVNRNRVYDAGIDLLDGGAQVGFSVTSQDTVPEVRLINTADEDMTGRPTNNPRLWAQLVRDDNSPIAGVTVKFTIVLGPGTVTEATAVTGADGIAFTTLSNLSFSEMTRARTEAVVDGKLYYSVLSVFRSLCCTHDQGHNQGHNQGFVSGP